jgi:hypothetical protein
VLGVARIFEICFLTIDCSSSDREHRIIVDPNRPGDQGEGLHCFKFWGHTVRADEYSGVVLEMLIDHRDIRDATYSLRFEEGTNRAELTKPILAGPFREDRLAYNARVTDNYLQVGQDAARAYYGRQSGDGRIKKFDVIFPPGFQLSQRIWAPYTAGAEGELIKAHHQIVAYAVPLNRNDAAGTPMITYPQRIHWKFVNMASKMDLTTTEDGGEAALNQAFDGL